MPEKLERPANLFTRIMGIVILCALILSLMPSSSEAIPAFARKYDLSCTSCHTKPPRLNAFGEAFHMAGFQIPMTEEGETRKKRKIGRIYSEADFLNIFSLRTHGNFAEYFSETDPSDANITLPQEAELYLAGTLTQNISYFFELEFENREIEGTDGGFEEKSRFGLGKEFFLMFNLDPSKGLFSMDGGREHADSHGSMAGPMWMGPMLMVGKIDPSTNFSYPTNRQFLLNVPGKVDAGTIKRFGLTPYAFASKFFGMKTGDGKSVEVTKEVLYNTSGDLGVDIHAMLGRWMFQAGLMQGLKAGPTDTNQKKDPYLMARMNFGGERYLSGSFSGLIYWGNNTGRVPMAAGASDTSLIDWLRYGFAGNVKYKLLDLYGAFIWDRIQDLPAQTSAVFDDKAFGFTLEGDYLASDRLLLSLCYDQLNSGGFVGQRADAKTLALQARFYVRDNFSLYLRDTYNFKSDTVNALQNFRNLVAVGVDLDF